MSPRDLTKMVRNYAYAINLVGHKRALELMRNELEGYYEVDDIPTVKVRFSHTVGAGLSDDSQSTPGVSKEDE